MELEEFVEMCDLEDVSDSALLKKREKLNPDVFKYLNDLIMHDFYNQYKSEFKIFKDFIVLAIDGSDWEIPNTPHARETFEAAGSKNPRKRYRS